MRRIRQIVSWFIGLLLVAVLGLGVGYGVNLYKDSVATTESTEVISEIPSETEASTEFEPNIVDKLTPPPSEVDYEFVEKTIFELVNQLREDLGAGTLEPNTALRNAAYIRAVEIEEQFSHTRPNGTEPFTVLEEEGVEYDYYMAGENLAMATYFRDDEYIAQLLFDGWVDSEEHYETMINPDFEEIGIGVHYDGEILYATQFFGVQQ